MIAAILAASIASLGLEELPQQKLDAGRCVVILWSKAQPPIRIAMVDETGQSLRIRRNRKEEILPATGPATYQGNGLKFVLDLEMAERQGLSDGAMVEAGSVQIEAAGGESLILPVGGIRACK